MTKEISVPQGITSKFMGWCHRHPKKATLGLIVLLLGIVVLILWIKAGPYRELYESIPSTLGSQSGVN